MIFPVNFSLIKWQCVTDSLSVNSRLRNIWKLQTRSKNRKPTAITLPREKNRCAAASWQQKGERSRGLTLCFCGNASREPWAHVFSACSSERAQGSRRPWSVCHASAWLAQTGSFKTLWLHCWGMNSTRGSRKSKLKFCHQKRAHVSRMRASIERKVLAPHSKTVLAKLQQNQVREILHFLAKLEHHWVFKVHFIAFYSCNWREFVGSQRFVWMMCLETQTVISFSLYFYVVF